MQGASRAPPLSGTVARWGDPGDLRHAPAHRPPVPQDEQQQDRDGDPGHQLEARLPSPSSGSISTIGQPPSARAKPATSPAMDSQGWVAPFGVVDTAANTSTTGVPARRPAPPRRTPRAAVGLWRRTSSTRRPATSAVTIHRRRPSRPERTGQKLGCSPHRSRPRKARGQLTEVFRGYVPVPLVAASGRLGKVTDDELMGGAV